jgi:hypothetical protein
MRLGMAYDWNKPMYFDYPVALLYSACLGRFVQLSADSGEYLHEKVVETVIMAIGCFACAIVIGIPLRFISRRFPVWLLTALLGSVFFAIGYGIVLFVDRSNVESAFTYLFSEPWQATSRFIVQTVLFSLPLVLVLASFRGVGNLIERYRRISLQ